MRTLEAIILLYERGLAEEAQSLVRVLFELQVTFLTFRRMLADDVEAACRRVLDGMMLAKMKQQRASRFAGLDMIPGAPSREVLEEDERRVKARYTEAEWRAIASNGFSGLNLEQRCSALDKYYDQNNFTETYNIVYRNFSRNVHATDIAELLMYVDPSVISTSSVGLVESRDATSCDVAMSAVCRMVVVVNREFGLRLQRRVDGLLQLRTDLHAIE